MRGILTAALAVSCLLCMAASTQVQQCPGQSFENLNDRVSIQNCRKPPCKLKRKSSISFELKFTPDHDIKELTTNVKATILGVPLPFIGVDGISACNKIFLASEPETPAPCPLKSGTEYLYKNGFPILEVYPRLTTVVHWSLSERSKDVICFEVPARII